MTKRPWLAVSMLAIAAALATRRKPGPLPDGSTLLPSGWRIRPAGRQVTVGTLPLGLATLSDGSVLVTNNGYAENGLMRIDPDAARGGRGRAPSLHRRRRFSPSVRERLGRLHRLRHRSVRDR